MKNKAEQIVAIRQASPELTLQAIGKQSGVSREYVRQVLKKAGLPTKGKGPGRWPRKPGSVEMARAKQKAWNRSTQSWSRQAQVQLGNGDIATVTELLVCADLVKRGHDVYRAVNHDSPADLVVYANGVSMRVEVKAARVSSTGTWCCRQDQRQNGRHDVIAWVAPDGSIRYRPEIQYSVSKKR